MLPYFKNYTNPLSLTGIELIAKGLTPTYPGDFQSDVKNGSLPSVSWILPPLAECEHPAAPPEWGEYLVQQVLNTLVSNPAVWAQTVFIVNYDENGGFFDHVPPAVRAGRHRRGVPDRHAAQRGGRHRRPDRPRLPHPGPGHLPVQRRRLQVLGHPRPHQHAAADRDPVRRHGAEPVGLAPRSVTGDFTGALNLASAPVTTVPSLPATSIVGNTTVVEEAVLNALTGTLDVGIDYPLPASNSMPAQETTPARPPVP